VASCRFAVEGINLFMVAAHEIGHALGLAHSTVAGSLMSRWHRRFDRDFVLPDDDVAAIQQLYGQSVCCRTIRYEMLLKSALKS